MEEEEAMVVILAAVKGLMLKGLLVKVLVVKGMLVKGLKRMKVLVVV